jgi:hypothetical protein
VVEFVEVGRARRRSGSKRCLHGRSGEQPTVEELDEVGDTAHITVGMAGLDAGTVRVRACRKSAVRQQ